MYATAIIETARAQQVVTVPRDAVGLRDGKRVVLRIADEQVRPCRSPRASPTPAAYRWSSGLNGGDLIVADARRALAPGTRVRPIRRD